MFNKLLLYYNIDLKPYAKVIARQSILICIDCIDKLTYGKKSII